MADPPAGLPRVMLHAAVRSIGGAPGSEGGSSHPHTPQVVENAVAGDLMVAQVGGLSPTLILCTDCQYDIQLKFTWPWAALRQSLLWQGHHG